jgi:hypothetical protein
VLDVIGDSELSPPGRFAIQRVVDDTFRALRTEIERQSTNSAESVGAQREPESLLRSFLDQKGLRFEDEQITGFSRPTDSLTDPFRPPKPPYPAFVRNEGIRVTTLPRAVYDEFHEVELRLLSDYPSLYSAIDRRRAEAEFRFAITPPLFVLAVYLSWAWTAWWILLTPVLVFVYMQGKRRTREANGLDADALQLGRVEAPTLERLKRAAGIPPDAPTASPPSAGERAD